MQYTTNLNLKKPEGTDFYNVDDFNDNADQIDAEFAKKGQPNGYATLDGGGRIPYSQLPESAMEYKGTWNAATNTPTLAQGVGTNGDMYIVSVGGTRFGETFEVNDRIVYDGALGVWQHIGGTGVTSVAGKTGAVTLNGGDIGAGTFAGKEVANASAASTLSDAQVRNIKASTTDLTAGSSALATGDIYIVYE